MRTTRKGPYARGSSWSVPFRVSELKLKTPLQVRVGIATGIVVVDSVSGESATKEGGVVGVTRNLAARLQAVVGAGQVVISQSTWELTQGFFDCADLGLIAVKGLAIG